MVASALVQLALVLVIAGAWWLIATRRREPFLRWVGLKRPRITQPRRFWTIAAIAFVGFNLGGLLPLQAVQDAPNLALAPFRDMGWAALPTILLYAVVQTSLTEEIFFRGLLGKTLIRAWGFRVGNAVQAVLFGLVHGLMFGSVLGWGVW